MNRRHCPTPAKIRYRDSDAAWAALAGINTGRRTAGRRETACYRCPCRGWHLTSKGRRRV